MKNLLTVMLLVLLSLGYWSGLVIAIGVAARYGPIPSHSPALYQATHAFAVAVIAAAVAVALWARFGRKAWLLALLVASPTAAHMLWSFGQLSQQMLSEQGLSLAKDFLLIALAPTIFSAAIHLLPRRPAVQAV